MEVLVPVDGSDASKLTIQWLADFLDKRQARIHVLYVADIRWAGAERELEQGKMLEILDDAKRQAEQEGFQVKEATYLTGIPSEKIIEYADRERIPMIIMGSQGKSGIGRLLMGSVSSEVFRNARQHVLILNNTQRPSLTMPLGPPPAGLQ